MTGNGRWTTKHAVRGRFLAASIAACAACLAASGAWAQQQIGPIIGGGGTLPGRGYPAAEYYFGLNNLAAGEYRDALGDFTRAGRSGLKIGQGVWIDSICAHAMTGEMYYLLGDNAKALEYYDAAVRVALAYSTWMMQLQLEPALRPANLSNRSLRAPNWGQSKRNRRLAEYGEKDKWRTGNIDQSQTVRQGGVVQLAQFYTVNVHQVVRSTALALRRRRELLGPLAADDELSRQAVAVFSRRQGLINHWSEVYLDVQLGMAFVGGGRDPQAKAALDRAIVAAGEYDHPMTGMVLLELGRIAMIEGQFDVAAAYFEEATYAAADYGDLVTLEEAFRMGSTLHLATNRAGVYALLSPALAWAKANRNVRHLQVSLLAMSAENLCYAGDAKSAAALLTEAKSTMRRDMIGTRVAARLSYTAALAAYQQNNLQGGNALLSAALDFQKTGSVWLFQRRLVDELYRKQKLSSRVAAELFAFVLRYPAPADWMLDPMEALSAIALPHGELFETWFQVALEGRNEPQIAFEIAELTRRHRFLSSTELGGRLSALRFVLDGPEAQLDQRALLERHEILARHPKAEQLSRQASAIRDELMRMPLASVDSATTAKQTALLGQLAQVASSQEAVLREIAVRREPCSAAFPPFRSFNELQSGLQPGQAVLSFFSTSRTSHAFLMDRENFVTWKTPAAANLLRDTGNFLRELGNFEQNVELGRDALTSASWKSTGKTLLESLMSGSKVSLPYNFEEVVIVPDGALWYLPFEALEVDDGAGGTAPLVTRVRVRYAPLASLGIGDTRPRYSGGNTAVVLGKLFPSDADERATAAFDALAPLVPEATALRAPLPASSAVYSTLFNRLVVLADIPAAASLGWSPVPFDRAPDAKLSDWLSLPLGGPEQVVLPGFHTAAERALKGMSVEGAGQEVFLSLCGLMANGARTILLSRWRTGGETSTTLVREFLQELPYTSASDAWQRSVLIARETPLDPAAEPRMRKESGQPTLADHPFFWSGYMLVDTGAPHTAEEPIQQPRPMPGDVVPLGDGAPH